MSTSREIPGWMIPVSKFPHSEALQILAKELPDGWTVQIDIQRGSGVVTLFGPYDDMYEPETGEGIDADLLQALQFSKFKESETEVSVNRAWAMFQDAMKQTGATP